MDIFIHLLYFCPPEPRLGAIVCWNAGKVYTGYKPEDIRKCHALLQTAKFKNITGKTASSKLVGVKWCDIHKEWYIKA